MQQLEEGVTGVSFPLARELWTGGELRCLGVGPRTKKVALVTIKAYGVALYADAAAAAAAFAGARQRQGTDEAAAVEALQGGAFTQALQMRLVRSVTGKQFTGALDENLRPIMRDDEVVLDGFCAYFADKQLDSGTEVTLLRRPDGAIDVCLRAPGDESPYASVQPGHTTIAPRLGQALWELYLGPKTPSPIARKAWLAALPALSS